MTIAKRYVVLFIVFTIIGIIFLAPVFRPIRYQIPNGAIEVGAGRSQHARFLRIKETEIVVSVPQSFIRFEVTFNFTDPEDYIIYALIPFTASSADPFFTYQDSSAHYEKNSQWGNLSFEGFHINNTLSSSGAKVVFKPSKTFAFNIGADFSLGISFHINSSLVAIDIPPFGSQTVILTFFGHTAETVDSTMETYRPGSFLTIDYPFIVHVEIPPGSHISTDTYPPPAEYYVRGDVRWAMFMPDFLEARYAQTVSCSFKNPNSDIARDVLIFLGGASVAIGGSFLAEAIKERVKHKKARKELTEKAKNEGGEQTEAKEDEEENDVLKLIRIVDRNYEFRWYYLFLRGPFALPLDTFIILLIIIELYLLSAGPSIHERIVIALVFVGVIISFFALAFHLREEALVEINFARFGKCVGKTKQPLLKALIKMRVKHKFDLETAYQIDQSLFSKQKLLERLYE